MSVKSCVKCLPWLKKLAKAKGTSKRTSVLKKAPKNLIRAIREIVKNILNGKISLKPKHRKLLKRYKNVLRDFSTNVKASLAKQKRFLAQKGGFLPGLLTPVISILASLVADKLVK